MLGEILRFRYGTSSVEDYYNPIWSWYLEEILPIAIHSYESTEQKSGSFRLEDHPLTDHPFPLRD